MPMSRRKFAETYPAGTTVVVDETKSGSYVYPTYWVGVLTRHDCFPDGELMGYPLITLAVKPVAAQLTDYWKIGRAGQYLQETVLSFDQARERYGDQPEFCEIPLCPTCAAGLQADGAHLWGGDHE